jgi:hypothetical protein
MEWNMTVGTVSGALMLAGWIAILLVPLSPAQSAGPGASVATSAATAPAATASNVRTKPTKHRYWRHRGGSHPHYGSRRIRT